MAREDGDRLEQMVDALLVLMTMQQLRQTGPLGAGPVRLAEFDGAIPFIEAFGRRLGDDMGSVDPWCEAPDDVRLRDLDGPPDIAIITRADTPSERPIRFFRLRRPSLREVRGWARRLSPTPLLMTRAFPLDGRADGALVGERELYSQTVGSDEAGAPRWIFNDVRVAADQLLPADDAWFCQLLLGIQFARRYEWVVRLGYAGGLSLSLPTDPIGARAVFRLRDIPEGAARRAALRHWVIEHWRQRRADPTEERLVREHLRGATRFDWAGLTCEIQPAAFDLERAERARVERAARRRDGSDRRPVEVAHA